MRTPVLSVLWLVLIFSLAPPARGAPKQTFVPQFPSCGPESEEAPDVRRFGDPSSDPLPSLDFCSRWNPEFIFNGHHCCGKLGAVVRSRRAVRCSAQRARMSYCSEVTPEQRDYLERTATGQVDDVLKLITHELGRKGPQSYCTVNNGFLAWGRPILPTQLNRIQLRSPQRCTEYGTDGMVAMLEWVGRQIVKDYPTAQYPGTRLLLGDIAAPRGGCLSGGGGRRGHLSHTTGQDADVGFLVAKPKGASPSFFHRDFEVKTNWPLIKHVLRNPYACVKVIFLDRRLIRKLSRYAKGDEDWPRFQRFIRHMPGHRNHMHVRIGDSPGPPGCVTDAHPELETEETFDDTDTLDSLPEQDVEGD